MIWRYRKEYGLKKQSIDQGETTNEQKSRSEQIVRNGYN